MKYHTSPPQEAARGPAQLVHRGAGLLGPDAVRLHLAAHPLVHARGTLAGGDRLWTGNEAERVGIIPLLLILIILFLYSQKITP